MEEQRVDTGLKAWFTFFGNVQNVVWTLETKTKCTSMVFWGVDTEASNKGTTHERTERAENPQELTRMQRNCMAKMPAKSIFTGGIFCQKK